MSFYKSGVTLNNLKIESGTVEPGIIFEKGLSKEHHFQFAAI